MSKEVVIYTDGACSGNPGPGGWGFIATTPLKDGVTGEVMLLDDKKIMVRTVEGKGGEKDTTNNRMELMAVIQALRHFSVKKEIPNITIVTDSQYVMKGMTEWIKGWKAKNWIGSNKKPVKNRDLWELLDGYCQKVPNLKWQWVKGHSGDHFNEAVDQLAVSGIPKE